ncbi:MAG: hypothetical protein IPQ07_40230, partial [Myxococcales bacterium]|nr:hypothetical protein [Myxococcales bacterium]
MNNPDPLGDHFRPTTGFSSPADRQLLPALAAGEASSGYFRLAEQFHTQAGRVLRGSGSLVVALNALTDRSEHGSGRAHGAGSPRC